MVSKLSRNSEQLREYDNIINDYLIESILEEVAPINKTDTVHYLPHRAVVKEERETRKTRTDFGKYQEGKLLNDMLDPGPSLLLHIFDILQRFRL